MQRFLLAALAAVALVTVTSAQEVNPAGHRNERLGYFVGTWEVSLTFRLPDGKEEHGRAACRTEWIMGGTFLRQQYTSTFMGQPLSISQLLGHDDQKRKFVTHTRKQ